MSNVEIYDSSNSQLSSDEYTQDEDDDALMDAAVSKQTPSKSKPKSNSPSAETSPAKSSSAATTPRKLSTDVEVPRGKTKRRPSSHGLTPRQQQQQDMPNLYFKRRSIKWLNQRFTVKNDYYQQLKEALPKQREHDRRMVEYRAAKRAHELQREEQERRRSEYRRSSRHSSNSRSHSGSNHSRSHSRHRSRTTSRSMSRSRNHSRSDSPELICLDDTENEDSPEKPVEPVRAKSVDKDVPNLPQQQQQIVKQPTPPPFALQLELGTGLPAENGSVLDEFLTLKPVAAAEPIIEAAAGINLPQQHQLDLSNYKALEPVQPAACLEMPPQEATLKRRRSVSPPASEPSVKKTIHTEDLEDDIIEFIPNDMTTTAKQQQSVPAAAPATVTAAAAHEQAPPQAPAGLSPLQKAQILTAAARLSSAEAANSPVLKLGSPYSLQPTADIDFYQKDSQPENLANLSSFSLETPTVEVMELSYTCETAVVPKATVSAPAELQAQAQAAAAAADASLIIQKLQQHHLQQQQKQLQQQQQELQQQQLLKEQQQQLLKEQQQQQELAQQQLLKEQQQLRLQQQLQRELEQQQLQREQQQQQLQKEQQQKQQQELQQQQLQQQQQLLQQQAQQELPQQQQQQQEIKNNAAKPHSETRQTQTAAQPSQAGRSKSSAPIDLNNSNSDAVFHQRVKELYIELDEIMTDKVRAVKPELKSYGEEKQRIEADIKTLDNLIIQKEEEHNRLLHLRCVKEELRARIERKERVLIMREILPSILNKNCSTSELYEMHSLLLNEHNAPMPSRYSPATAVEQLINRVENGLDDIKILRSALGMQEKATVSQANPPPNHSHYEHLRCNSVPAMRPPPPPTDRSAVFGRQGAVRDVRSLIEDFRREHPEELPIVGKRNKLPPPTSRYQQLINESKQLTGSGSALDLPTAASSYRKQHLQAPPAQRNSLDNNHYDNEAPLKPLYNSSPLASSAHQSRVNNDNSPHYNEIHSIYRGEQLQELDASRASRSKQRLGVTSNGAEELERRCQYCERYKATHMCAACKNQWYCSKECQLHAWDTHWETCGN